jgi:phosphoserine phosphatase
MIKAVLFDMDGTLVQYDGPFRSSWDAVGYSAGLKAEWNRLLEDYFPKKDAYWEWMDANAQLLRGLSFEQIRSRVLPPPYTPGARETMRALKPKYKLGILTSGLDFVAAYICQDLEMNFYLANGLSVCDGVFTGTCERRVYLWNKAQHLRELCRSHGLDLREVCFVGDHANDIPAMNAVGFSIAFAPKDAELLQAADAHTEDFREIPKLISELALEASPP